MDVDEYARLHNVSSETVRRWIRTGKLNAKLEGRKYIITEGDVVPAYRAYHTDDTQLLHRISQLESENQLLRSQVETFRREIEEKNGHIRALQGELSELRKDAEESRRRADVLIAQLQEYLTRPWWKKVLGRRQLPPHLETASSSESKAYG